MREEKRRGKGAIRSIIRDAHQLFTTMFMVLNKIQEKKLLCYVRHLKPLFLRLLPWAVAVEPVADLTESFLLGEFPAKLVSVL